MNNILLVKKIFIVGAIVLLCFGVFIPRAGAQFGVPYYYNPAFSFGPFGYVPFLPPAPPLFGAALGSVYRYAHVPLTATTSSLFPAPTLPAVPVSTIGGVGLTTLIPSVPVTLTLPVNSLITTPLAGLITYTPLSLVGLTYAPVPITTTALPIVVPTVTPTTTTTSLISLLSSLLI